tara:strand:+ start:108 stop:296 length:189 start_codon:yes stop_codon:yes gene_type:complete
MSTVGNKLFDGIEFQLNVVIKAIADNEITQARGLQILLDNETCIPFYTANEVKAILDRGVVE